MTKKHFISLAESVKRLHVEGSGPARIVRYDSMLDMLADFCKESNRNFNRDCWLDYIDGKCGPCGGTIKPRKERSITAAIVDSYGCGVACK